MIPHATGPISVAALTHTLGVFWASVLMDAGRLRTPPYLPRGAEFHRGKLWPRNAPGIGVEFDPKGATLLSETTEKSAPIPLYHRPDGSITNW